MHTTHQTPLIWFNAFQWSNWWTDAVVGWALSWCNCPQLAMSWSFLVMLLNKTHTAVSNCNMEAVFLVLFVFFFPISSGHNFIMGKCIFHCNWQPASTTLAAQAEAWKPLQHHVATCKGHQMKTLKPTSTKNTCMLKLCSAKEKSVGSCSLRFTKSSVKSHIFLLGTGSLCGKFPNTWGAVWERCQSFASTNHRTICRLVLTFTHVETAVFKKCLHKSNEFITMKQTSEQFFNWLRFCHKQFASSEMFIFEKHSFTACLSNEQLHGWHFEKMCDKFLAWCHVCGNARARAQQLLHSVAQNSACVLHSRFRQAGHIDEHVKSSLCSITINVFDALTEFSIN